MPYLITTYDRHEVYGTPRAVVVKDRRAVATLDEARDHVHSLGANYGVMAHLDCVLDGTSRMPIGPLPDGTTIEVAPMEWRGGPITSDAEARAIVDAYNAQVTA